MFVEAPFISLMIFGLPFGVISIVCYFLCCVDASDQPEAEDFSDSEEEEHQYLLDEASRLHDEMKYSKLKINRLLLATSFLILLFF